ncbi:MAG: WbqC family protein [bacterium]|nr:WbqC family protein [bacterium]
MAYATDFLLLDDVQYRHRFYHNRASIKNSQGLAAWMTLPVAPTHRCPLVDVRLSPSFDVEALNGKVRDAYRRSPYYDAVWPRIRELIEREAPVLWRVCAATIEWVMLELGLTMPRIFSSSASGPYLDPTARLLYGCGATGADWIIMGEGGSLDCHRTESIERAGVAIAVQQFADRHPVYEQLGKGDFVPYLSILDPLMCVGPEATRELVLKPWVFEATSSRQC